VVARDANTNKKTVFKAALAFQAGDFLITPAFYYQRTHQDDAGRFYAAFSDDGIHWPPERRQQIWKVPVIARNGFEVAWHPTFILSDEKASRGWLYYGYSENWGYEPPSKPHYMQRRMITIR